MAWLGLAWLGLAWLGSARLGLAWLGLAWLGLAWLGSGVEESFMVALVKLALMLPTVLACCKHFNANWQHGRSVPMNYFESF
jgi:hypothetical protein